MLVTWSGGWGETGTCKELTGESEFPVQCKTLSQGNEVKTVKDTQSPALYVWMHGPR